MGRYKKVDPLLCSVCGVGKDCIWGKSYEKIYSCGGRIPSKDCYHFNGNRLVRSEEHDGEKENGMFKT